MREGKTGKTVPSARLEHKALTLLLLCCIASAYDRRVLITLKVLAYGIPEDLGWPCIIVIVQVSANRVSDN